MSDKKEFYTVEQTIKVKYKIPENMVPNGRATERVLDICNNLTDGEFGVLSLFNKSDYVESVDLVDNFNVLDEP